MSRTLCSLRQRAVAVSVTGAIVVLIVLGVCVLCELFGLALPEWLYALLTLLANLSLCAVIYAWYARRSAQQ
jgi:hypothetical protein